MDKEECIRRRQALAGGFEGLRDVFSALGDANRQLIVAALLANDGESMRVGEITECTHLSRPAVSHHLRTLHEAGLVQLEKVGTMNFYSADVDSAMWARFAALAAQVGDALARARAAEEEEDAR